MSTSVDGLISGLNTTQLISQLMQIEAQPQAALQVQQQKVQTTLSAYQSLNSKMQKIGTAASNLAQISGWNAWSATSSDATAVTASASSSSIGGTLSFTVDHLATAGSVVSSGSVASLSSAVASGPTILVAKGGAGLGLASVAGNGLSVGNHTVTVTQSSSGAAFDGATLGPSTVIDASNNTLNVTVDGNAQSLTIASGSYTQAQLAAAVQSASGGALTVSTNGNGGLHVATTAEGSSHTLSIDGGSAVTSGSLGLTAQAQVTGRDGILQADNGATVQLSDVRAGVTTTLASDAGGSIAVTLAGGLRAGTITGANVSTGDGSLQSVVAAINGASAGVTASAVQVGTAAFRLQLTSSTVGAASGVSMDASDFNGIGSLTTLTQAQDAQLTVGSGAGAYQVVSSTNTVSNVMPGVTLNLLKSNPGATVTVDVARDGSGLADGVQKMVDAANAALNEIGTDIAYNASTKQAGVLIGDPLAQRLQQRILDAVSSAVGSSSLSSAGLAGLSTSKDGTLNFDKNAFLSAYNKNPSAVAALFQQGGVSTDSGVSLVSARNATSANGTPWAVNVTTAAAKAEVDGAVVAGGVLSSSETISLRVGTASVAYNANAGDSLTSVANGMNQQIAKASLGLAVTVEGGKLVVRSNDYGSGVQFDVQSTGTGLGLVTSAGQWETHSGIDVAGTINGVAATGTGQLLSAPASDSVLGGVILRVDGSATGARGTFTYAPGVAQRLASLSDQTSDFVDGTLTLAIQGNQTQITRLGQSIADWDTRLALRQAALKQQFSNLEVTLGQLKDQGNYLSGQLANLG